MNYTANTGRNACATLKLPNSFFAAQLRGRLACNFDLSFNDLSLIGITENHRFLIKISIRIVIRTETHLYLNLNPNLNLFRPSTLTAR